MNSYISVVIPTYNDNHLPDVLTSLNKQKYPANKFEIIVVENPIKTDRVYSLCRRFNVRYFVSELGSNKARNKGITYAKGGIIALCDDDIILDEYWLQSIANVYESCSSVGVVGGRVKLQLPDNCPKWVTGNFLKYLSHVDYGDVTLCWEKDDKETHIVSANATFPKNHWIEIGGFNDSIGYQGNNLIGNDEVEFFEQCADLGVPHYTYESTMLATHIIDESKTNLDWFRRRFYGQGVADGFLHKRQNPDKDILDTYHDDIQYVPERVSLYDSSKNYIRNHIQDEHAMREYIKNLIICKTDYMVGFQNTVLPKSCWSFLN